MTPSARSNNNNVPPSPAASAKKSIKDMTPEELLDQALSLPAGPLQDQIMKRYEDSVGDDDPEGNHNNYNNADDDDDADAVDRPPPSKARKARRKNKNQ